MCTSRKKAVMDAAGQPTFSYNSDMQRCSEALLDSIDYDENHPELPLLPGEWDDWSDDLISRAGSFPIVRP